MAIETINSLSSITSLKSIIKTNEIQDDVFIPFKEVLSQAIDNVNETDAQNTKNMVDIALGQADNLHQIMIDSAKADLALQTLVQVRNKALDAYNEIMRITL